MAVRQIERAVLLDPEDIAIMSTPFASKGNGDPLVKAFRAALRDSAPGWLASIDASGDTVSKPKLDELLAGVAHRRRLVELLPEGEARAAALAPLDTLDALVRELLDELGDDTATDAAHDTATDPATAEPAYT